MTTRRKYTAEFKAKVATELSLPLEAILMVKQRSSQYNKKQKYKNDEKTI